MWEDALTRRAARRLWEKVGRTKGALKEKGVTVPRELLNSLKAAKWRLFQPKLHPEVRIDKWWALNRLFIDLKELLRREEEVAAGEEEEEVKKKKTKIICDTLGDQARISPRMIYQRDTVIFVSSA